MSVIPTIILRHKKENKKKCSLSGLEERKDFLFLTYPKDPILDLSSYILLSMDGDVLQEKDQGKGIFLIDATWRYAKVMEDVVCSKVFVEKRSLPKHFQTAYPRKQTDCPDPSSGLASIEALFVAFCLLKKDPSNLLNQYYWKDLFLEKNKLFF
jgi:pre-rRNA-processing protein TSR3